MNSATLWTKLAFDGVILGWLVMVVVFALRRSRSLLQTQPEARRDRTSLLAMALQGVGFFAVWAFKRPHGTSLFAMPPAAGIATGIVAVVLAAASVALATRAVLTLGKQWALVARVVEGHRLVTEGPYARVRNPIYTGMLGMLIATGLVASRWQALLVGVAIFLLGTWLRVRIEERLLRSTFGAKFDDYVRKVPALLPRLF